MDEPEQADQPVVWTIEFDVRAEDALTAADDERFRLRRLLDEAQQSETDARRAIGLLNSIINLLPVGVTVQAEDGAIVLANELAATLPTDEDFSAAVETITANEADGDAGIVTEERSVGSVGAPDERSVLIRRRPVRILDRSLLLSTSFDFTERKQAEAELSKRAYFDELTGLPNGALI